MTYFAYLIFLYEIITTNRLRQVLLQLFINNT